MFPLQIPPMMRFNLFSPISNESTKHIFGVSQAKSGYISSLIKILTMLERHIGMEHHTKGQVRFKGGKSMLVTDVGDEICL